MDNSQPVRFFKRGYSPSVQIAFFTLLSLALMFMDARYQYLGALRYVLSAFVQPVQRLVTMPSSVWQDTSDFFYTQSSLTRESVRLQQQHALDGSQLQQVQALVAENQQLRKLMDVQAHSSYPALFAEIVYAERDVFKRKVLVNKGAQANVQAGQVVVDAAGVVGQVTRVYPWLSEITLITDKDQSVPAQVLRNGLRTIVFGSGDISHLALRYMPVSSDIQENDVLVTSGIDGIYPPGLPVARVSKIVRDPAYPFARIECEPLAGVDKQRFLMILSGAPVLPDRPEAEAAAGDGHLGKRNKASMKP